MQADKNVKKFDFKYVDSKKYKIEVIESNIINRKELKIYN